MDILFQLFEPINLLIMVLGVVLGILIGALPGLTPTMGVAMAIPFTFSLPAEQGLLLLGGIYSGSVYGGSIPAILFNIPGAPASVASTFEGYPMAKKGEAKKALELSTISSAIGGLFGMLLLLFFAPPLTKVALQFGPTESFWIAVFGITIIAVITGGSVTKNMIGGSIGILISMIGIHTITGTARFTFGSNSLIGGLNIVPVLIGLFAFPQALRLIDEFRNKQQKHEVNLTKQTSLLSSFIDIIRHPKSLSIGTIMGLLVGIAPGAGGNVASIMAYNELVRFSKNKDDFGKGNKEGIIASESANNASVGGALVPLLTLGIPGSPTAAIFLGGLMIHGIWPGRNLFVEHANVANLFLYGMILIQILILIIGLYSIRHLSKLINIPNHFMAPVIISFSIIGAYTAQNNSFDIYTMAVIGILMYIFQKFDFSPAPIALGFILGPIAEESLLQGIAIGSSNGSIFSYFISSGWSKMFIATILFTMLYSIWNSIRQGKGRAVPSQFSFHFNSLFSLPSLAWLIFISVLSLSLYPVFTLRFEMMIFPAVILIILLSLAIVQWLKSLFNGQNRQFAVLEGFPISSSLFIFFIFVVSLLTNHIGFYTQVLILMVTIPIYYYLNNNKAKVWSKILLISASFTFAMYWVFSGLIKVPLPTGFTLNIMDFFIR